VSAVQTATLLRRLPLLRVVRIRYSFSAAAPAATARPDDEVLSGLRRSYESHATVLGDSLCQRPRGAQLSKYPYPKGIHPDAYERFEELLAWGREQGISAKPGSGLRTCEEQEDLWQRGITPARGCRSFHTWGRAIDIYNASAEELRALGEQWRRMGGVWGESFNDPVHFEWHPEVSYPIPQALCPNDDLLGACQRMQEAMGVPQTPVLRSGFWGFMLGAALAGGAYMAWRRWG
jgi:hypothetical protein